MRKFVRKLASSNLIGRLCSIDVTRVLLLDLSTELSADVVHDNTPATTKDVKCRLLNDTDLRALVHDPDFQITPQFVDDFQRFGFVGVAVIVNSQIAGVLFLVSHVAAARHNSGGNAFNGIALDLPDGVSYLFKVFVKPEFRGGHKMATMLRYVVGQLKPVGIQSIVTTTHWANAAFLRSAEQIGFTRCGFASEIVLASKHLYQLPAPFRPGGVLKRSGSGSGSDTHDDERLSVRFLRPNPDYS